MIITTEGSCFCKKIYIYYLGRCDDYRDRGFMILQKKIIISAEAMIILTEDS